MVETSPSEGAKGICGAMAVMNDHVEKVKAIEQLYMYHDGWKSLTIPIGLTTTILKYKQNGYRMCRQD